MHHDQDVNVKFTFKMVIFSDYPDWMGSQTVALLQELHLYIFNNKM